AFFYAVAAGLRLARFNSRTALVDKRYFEGLPSPSSAGTVAGFVWVVSAFDVRGLPALVLAFLITIVVGALMVSKFSYWSGKDIDVRGRIRWVYASAIPLVFVIVALAPESLFTLFAMYTASAPAYWVWRRIRRKQKKMKE
ncbi:MAG: CDP-diacylglycerol--serine O-phosphatidyltransferase, partial [Xanthomonadaceae bacterium]|nr:CDP-diacylglycerol--serine O-phosphatidyltransferase [Xanthomonadaceae bacterium]